MPIEFCASERSSLGIEMELELVDPASRELVCTSSEILQNMGRGHPDGAHPRAKHELLQCTVELLTGVCKTVSDARSDLETTLMQARAAAAAAGTSIMCSGTHPFSDWAAQTVTPQPRYAALVEQIQWPGRRMAIFGVHYHVGVRSAEKAVAIANALCSYLPHFLALSASSPYWKGVDTGLHSVRTKIFEGLPTAGVPYPTSSWADFEQFMDTLIGSGFATSIREVWWDVRPHPRFGTVELRICDGIPNLTDVAALAALIQCLVEWMDTLHDRGYALPAPRDWIVRQNKWLAARYGLAAEIITDDSGAKRLLRHAIEETVEELTPVSRRLGCEAELRGVVGILESGNSSDRQRAMIRDGATLTDVVDGLVSELADDAV